MKKIDINPADDIRGAGGGGGGGSTPYRTPDNIRMQDWMECVLGLGYGPIKGLAPGQNNKLENFYVGDTPLFNVGTNQANFPNFRVKIYAGLESDPAINFVLGGAASNQVVNVQTEYNVPIVRSTSVLQRGRIDRLEIRLVFQRLVRVTDKSATYDGTAEFRIEYKPSNSNTWSLYQGQSVTTMTGKTSANSPKDFIIPVPRLLDDDWDVRVTKLTPENNSDVGTFADFVFESIQMVETAPKKYDDIAVVHLVGRATNQFASVPDFYGVYDGLIVHVPSNYDPVTKTYNESTPWNGLWKLAWTDNPAFLLRELIMNPMFGMAAYYLHVSVVDAEFYNAGKWCDASVPVGTTGRTRPRFTMNMVVTEAMQGMEFLRYIAGAFNSTIFDDGNGNISLRTDEPRAPSYIFTPESVTEEGFSYSYTDIAQRYNDITVVFGNKNLEYSEDRRKATMDNTDAVAQNGLIPYEFVAIGCDNVDEAVARANYRYMIANTEVTTVSFRTTRLGMLLDVFDTIYVADPRSGWSTGGRVKSIANGIMHLRDPIYFETQAQVTLRVQTYEGLRVVQAIPVTMGVNYSLQLSNPAALPDGTYPDRTTFTVEDTVAHGLAKPFRVISVEESETGLDGYTISAIEVNVNKYHDADLGVESAQVDYSYKTPGEPILPPELVLETGTAHIIVNNDGTLINRIYANWERPLNAFTAYYELDYKQMSDSTWTTVKASENDAYLGPVQDDMLYHIRLFAITPTGRRGREYLERVNFRVSGKSLGLDVPTGVVVEKGQTGWVFGWDQPTGGDYDGMEIRQGGVNNNWDTARVIARRLKDNRFQYQWLGEGITRFFFKYRDTSGNESNQAVAIDVEVYAPPAPVVKAETRNGLLNLLWSEVNGTQPTDVYQFRWGTADTTPTDATPAGQTRGTGLTLALNDPTIRRGHLRAVDAGGNVSPWTSFEVGMEDTVDPTPPPTVTGLTATAALNSITIVTDVATYKVGHGHRNTRLYAAQVTEDNPDPQFSESLFVGTFQGSVETFPATMATRWRFWAKWTTNDGYDSVNPSDPAEAETGRVGDAQLAEDLDLASKLADGSISGTKLANGAIDATKFANGLEPVTIIPDGQDLPTEKLTSSIVWDGQTYIWDAAQSKYIKPAAGTVSAEDIEGVIEAGQIKDGAVTNTKLAPGAIDSTKFAEGVEPVSIVTTPTLPTTKSTTTIVWQGKLYRWNGTAYTASVGAVDIDGKLVSTQISDNAIASNHVQANAITAGKIAVGVVNAREIAAGAITASKIKVSAMGDALNPDSLFTDQAVWDDASGFSGGGTSGRLPVIAKVADPYQGDSVLVATNYTWPLYDRQKFPIDPKKQYLLEIAARNRAGAVGPLYGVWRFFDADGVVIPGTTGLGWPAVNQSGGNFYAPSAAQLTTTWQRFSYPIGGGQAIRIPENARFMSANFTANYNTSVPASVTEIGLLRVSQMVAGELIVDGAITADKITANTITGDKIAANTITASKLQIVDGANVFPDFDMVDRNAYESSAAASTYLFEIAPTFPKSGRNILVLLPQTFNLAVRAYRETIGALPVEPNTEYFLQATLQCTDSTARIYTTEMMQQPDGSLTSLGDSVRISRTPNADAGTMSVSFTTGQYTKRISITFRRDAGGTAAAYFGGVTLRRKTTGVLIADGAVTAEKIAADSITAGKISAGAISAREIAAGAITASKLTLVDPTNYYPDYDMLDDAAYESGAAAQFWSFGGSSSQIWGKRALVVPAAAVERSVYAYRVTPSIAVEIGKQYYAEAAFYCADAASAIYYVEGTLAANGTVTWGSPKELWTRPAGVNTDRIGNTITIPAGVRRIAIIFTRGMGGSASAFFGGMTLRRRNGGELIVDGAITANKIAANAIAVGTAAIQNAAIVDAMIGNLSADKITAGYLAAARIQAGTITTGHLAANSINADKIQAGAVTSDKMFARSIAADRLVAGSITSAELVANNAFIINGTLQGAKIGAAQIGTAHIQDAAIATAKIGVAQIDTLRIAGNSVVTSNVVEFSATMGVTSGIDYATTSIYLPYGGFVLLFLDAKGDAIPVEDTEGTLWAGRTFIRTNIFGEIWQMVFDRGEKVSAYASTRMFKGFWCSPYIGAGNTLIADAVITRPNNNYRNWYGRFAALGMQR